MIEEMKERLLEHKTVAAVLGTVLVMLVVFFAWSSVTRPQAQLQSDLPTISSSIPASSSLETTKTKTMASHSQDDSGKIFVDIKGAVKNEGVYELSMAAVLRIWSKKLVDLQMMLIRSQSI